MQNPGLDEAGIFLRVYYFEKKSRRTITKKIPKSFGNLFEFGSN